MEAVPEPGESAPIPLTDGLLDRDAERREEPGLLDRLLADPATRVLELRGDRLPIRRDGDGPGARLVLRLPDPTDRTGATAIYLGRAAYDPGLVWVAVLAPRPEEDTAAEDPDATATQWLTLRDVGADLAPDLATLAATALGVGNWHRTHGHCPRCGAPTVAVQAGWVRRCEVDGSLHFPRTDPAVIMAVVDQDDRLLLARGAQFRSGGMSVLAGFVEPGETFAAAVAREVAEEVGLVVSQVRLVADQPWPFPSSLMIGCTARVTGSTELRPQESEILAARWFTRTEIVAAVADESLLLPGRMSIARHLIELWFGGPLPGPDWSLRR